MASGIVLSFDGQRGLIQPDTGDGEICVHVGAMELAGLYALKQGQKLYFDIERSPRTGEVYADNLQIF